MTITTLHHKNDAFAAVDQDHFLERIAGGNETEVYRTDDRRYVVKLKQDMEGHTLDEAVHWAQIMRAGADAFADCLGAEHSVPSYYMIARDSDGHIQVLVVQPFVAGRQLFSIDYGALSPAERAELARKLRDIIRRALTMYRATGSMPDLYGRSSTSSHERTYLNQPHMLPWRLWSFLIKRNLLRSHNLMQLEGEQRRVVLIDYDIVRRSKLYRTVYYAVRWLLFWRDHALIELMKRRGFVPGAQGRKAARR
jgi:hypothetical protein